MTPISYTDGSCIKTNNTDKVGKGSWGWVLINEIEDIVFESNGEVYNDTTNNRMELQAVLELLDFCKDYTKKIIIRSDSMYVINCAQNIWKRSKNIDLWKIYDTKSKNIDIVFEKVKAHSGNYWNDYVDNLAKKSVM